MIVASLPPPNLRSPKFPADKTRSYVVIEYETRRTRRDLGFNDDEPLPSLPFFDSLLKLRTGARRDIPLDYAVSKLLEGVEAQTIYYSTPAREVVIVLSEATYAGLERDLPRSRFSAAHETGHAVQHYDELARLSNIPHAAAALLRGGFDDLPVYADVEWQANAFAGALLMPAIGLAQLEAKGRLDIPNLSNRFGTSAKCAEIRLTAYLKRKAQLLAVK